MNTLRGGTQILSPEGQGSTLRFAFRDFRLFALIVVCLWPLGAYAGGVDEATGTPDPEGWTPSVRIGFGFHVQGLDGSAFSPDSLPPIQSDPDFASVGAPGDSAKSPAFRLGIRLYAPEDLLGESRYAPRIFIQGLLERPLDDGFIASRYDVDFDFLDGDVGDVCPLTPPTRTCSYSAKTSVDILYNWAVTAGLDIRLPVWEGQFHLVPSFGYFGQATEGEGTFGLILASSVGLGSDDDRAMSASSGTEVSHGVTTGLAFEIDVLDGEAFSAKVFLETNASWILTNRDSRFSSTNVTPTPNFNQAEFLIRPSGFAVMSGAGVEIRWRGLHLR